MRVPIKVQLTRKCERCGLRYAASESACPHCSGLSDQQVLEIRARHRREQEGNANLGRLFLYIAGLLLVGLLIFTLGKS